MCEGVCSKVLCEPWSLEWAVSAFSWTRMACWDGCGVGTEGSLVTGLAKTLTWMDLLYFPVGFWLSPFPIPCAGCMGLLLRISVFFLTTNCMLSFGYSLV